MSPILIDDIYLTDSKEDESHGSSQHTEDKEGLQPPKKWKIDHTSGVYKMKRMQNPA